MPRDQTSWCSKGGCALLPQPWKILICTPETWSETSSPAELCVLTTPTLKVSARAAVGFPRRMRLCRVEDSYAHVWSWEIKPYILSLRPKPAGTEPWKASQSTANCESA